MRVQTEDGEKRGVEVKQLTKRPWVVPRLSCWVLALTLTIQPIQYNDQIGGLFPSTDNQASNLRTAAEIVYRPNRSNVQEVAATTEIKTDRTNVTTLRLLSPHQSDSSA